MHQSASTIVLLCHISTSPIYWTGKKHNKACQWCIHLKQCDCHKYFMALTKQTKLSGRKQTTYSKVTYKFLQQKEVNYPLVPYCTHHFQKVLLGFSSPTDFETGYDLIHGHSANVLRTINSLWTTQLVKRTCNWLQILYHSVLAPHKRIFEMNYSIH